MFHLFGGSNWLDPTWILLNWQPAFSKYPGAVRPGIPWKTRVSSPFKAGSVCEATSSVRGRFVTRGELACGMLHADPDFAHTMCFSLRFALLSWQSVASFHAKRTDLSKSHGIRECHCWLCPYSIELIEIIIGLIPNCIGRKLARKQLKTSVNNF